MIIKIILTIISIVWMIVIFKFSNSPVEESTATSDTFIDHTFVKTIQAFDKEVKKEVKKQKLIEKLRYPIRKLAHFIEYFILGILLYITFKLYGLDNIYVVIGVCGVYACTDEIHQLFVPGRGCKLTDLLIDTLGAITGCLILSVIKII